MIMKENEKNIDTLFPREEGVFFPCNITTYFKLLEHGQVGEFFNCLSEYEKDKKFPPNTSNIVKMLVLHVWDFDKTFRIIKDLEYGQE